MRKIKLITLTILLSLSAAFNMNAGNFGWNGVDNEQSYKALKEYLWNMLPTFAGEPVFYLLQDFISDLDAAHLSDEYAWLGQSQSFCTMLEKVYGPSMSHPLEGGSDRYEKIRRAICMLRDYPMHEASIVGGDDVDVPKGQNLKFLYATRTWLGYGRNEILAFLAGPRPKDAGELQVAKLYNCGFILRSSNTTVGIDIAYKYGFGNNDGVSDIASMLDVLFVTHKHGDHFDVDLINKMLELGKPVVMPSDISTVSKGPKIIWGESHTEHTMIAGKVSTAAIMSAQGTEPNLIYHFEFDGWTVIHVGDNSIHANENPLKDYPTADLVFSPVFQEIHFLFNRTMFADNSRGVQQIYINCHENEYHHAVGDRVSYRYLYNTDTALAYSLGTYPCNVLLDNCEHITIRK